MEIEEDRLTTMGIVNIFQAKKYVLSRNRTVLTLQKSFYRKYLINFWEKIPKIELAGMAIYND